MEMRKLLSLIAISFASLLACAQPAAVKNVGKSVFTLTTYKADGSLLATSHGVFVGKDGEAISSMKPFDGAAKAVATDSKGNKLNVVRILGANEIYDVIKFRVDGKTIPATLATQKEEAGADVWVAGNAGNAAAPAKNKIRSVETFNGTYPYYILAQAVQETAASCPVVNGRGEVMALAQTSQASGDTHATSAMFANSLTVTGLSQTDPVLRRIGIAAALPSDYGQAQVALALAPQILVESKYEGIVSDFIEQFPDAPDGYTARAQLRAAQGNHEDADRDMQTAISKAGNKADAHFAYARLMYDNVTANTGMKYGKWNYDKVIEEAQRAYGIDKQPLYQHLQYEAMFMQKKYQEAYDGFMSLTTTTFRSPALFHEAALCKKEMGAPADEVMALIDSAIMTTDTLRLPEAAPYLMTRASLLEEAGRYRDAVLDYARVQILLNDRLGADFFYKREQAEIKAKMYGQAISDINQAIKKDPQEPMYYAEKASLLLRINMKEEAIDAARQCIGIAPEYGEGYLLLGLAQVHAGKKEEGLANLRRAKELGEEQADALIEKYQ